MSDPYNVNNWYWVVAGSATHVYSSAALDYVAISDGTYVAWLARGNLPTAIATHALLVDVLVQAEIEVPTNRDLPFVGIVGLDFDADYSTRILTVNPGSVMDSTGTILLTLDEEITKDLALDWTAGDAGGAMVRVQCTGTITATTTTITGSSTLFETELTDSVELSDYTASGGTQGYRSSLSRTGAGANGTSLSSITSDTQLSHSPAIGGSGVNYMRGALDSRWSGSAVFSMFVLIVRKDSDGSIDIALTSIKADGLPDLPAGYTYYRCIGAMTIHYGLGEYIYDKHIYNASYPFALEAGNFLFADEVNITSPNGQTIKSYIAALTEKTTLVDDDLFMVLDSADANAPKKATASTISTYAMVPRNRVVNGGMQISQQNGTTAGTTTAYFPADQWEVVHSSDGAFSAAQVASASPAGSPYRLRVSITTADGTIGAAQRLIVRQKIEGSQVADFLFGTASARAGVIRFGLKAPAGTYGVSLQNAAADRSFIGTVTVSVANTDAVYEVAFTGDTSGTWPTGDVHGWTLTFAIAAGSNFQNSAGWSGTDDLTTSSQSNGMSSNTNVFEFFDVGLKMDVAGSSSYGVYEVPDPVLEQIKCDRYYQRYGEGTELYQRFVSGAIAASTTSIVGYLFFRNPMRASPTIAFSGGTDFLAYDSVNLLGGSANSALDQSIRGFTFTLTTTGATQYRPYQLTANNTLNARVFASSRM